MQIKRSILLIFAMIFIISCNTIAMIINLPIKEKINSSEYIIEAEIINKHSYWNSDSTAIFTEYNLKILNTIQGKLNKGSISFEVFGGRIGHREMISDPGFHEEVNSIGVFFLNQNKNNNSYTLFGNVQGFIKYDILTNSAVCMNDFYPDIEKDLYPLFNISRSFILGINKSKIQDQEFEFIPSTVTGGTRTILTIRGSGFGKEGDFSSVRFTDNNNGGAGWIQYFQSIISWNDNEIKVIVPSRAGTGEVYIVKGDGKIIKSSNTLNVKYSILDGLTTMHISTDDNGSRVFSMDSYFGLDSIARNSFFRALETWRCTCHLNGSVQEEFANYKHGFFDGKNSIYFDNLSTGILASTKIGRAHV